MRKFKFTLVKFLLLYSSEICFILFKNTDVFRHIIFSYHTRWLGFLRINYKIFPMHLKKEKIKYKDLSSPGLMLFLTYCFSCYYKWDDDFISFSDLIVSI